MAKSSTLIRVFIWQMAGFPARKYISNILCKQNHEAHILSLLINWILDLYTKISWGKTYSLVLRGVTMQPLIMDTDPWTILLASMKQSVLYSDIGFRQRPFSTIYWVGDIGHSWHSQQSTRITGGVIHGNKSCRPGGPFYYYGSPLIPPWISNHMPSKVWDKITYPFPGVLQLLTFENG